MLGELNSECMRLGDLNTCKDFMTRVHVRNTFLDCSVDDPWVVNANSSLRRQQTDSILHRSSTVRDELSRDTQVFSSIPDMQLHAVPTILDVDQRTLASSEEEMDEKHAEDDPRALLESVEQSSSRLSPEIQVRREVAANGGGLGGCTTVMMKQVPLKYSQRKLLREINDSGFAGKYDFLFLPMDSRSHANRGFAFVNLVSAGVAEEFYKKFHGQYLRHFSAEKAIVVLPADLQGFEENALQYATTAARKGVLVGRRAGHTKPVFLRSLPPHIAAKIDENRSPTPPMLKNKPLASRLPEKTMRHNHDNENVQKMADLLQQALFPAMLQASLPLLLAQAQPPPVAAKPTPGFCAYCGKKRLPDHVFCAYCGSSF
jgi:hypothetical protein